ncbi:probable splicing factor, arginine/serine-rich 6 isoform X2 [Ptychodera flava]
MVASRIYVGDLRPEVRKEDLEREFSKCGRVIDIWIARNPPGFAFLEFDNPKDADSAVRSLDGKTVCGSRVRVELSRGRGRGGGSGGRDRSSRGDRGPPMRGYGGPPSRGPLPPPPGGYRDYPSDYSRFESRYDEPRSRWSDSYGSSWGSRSSPPTGYRSRSPVRRRSPPPPPPRSRDYPREYRDYQDYSRDYPPPPSRYGSSRYDRPPLPPSSYERMPYDRAPYDRPPYDRPPRSPPRR